MFFESDFARPEILHVVECRSPGVDHDLLRRVDHLCDHQPGRDPQGEKRQKAVDFHSEGSSHRFFAEYWSGE